MRASFSARFPFSAFSFPARLLVSVLFACAPPVVAQTKGAELVRQPKPVYPETLSKALRQGNVLLIGRIDTAGKVQDTKVVATSHPDFVQPALAAVRDWQFRPATRDGKPVQIAANIALRFRLDGDTRGQIPRPTLGDLAVFPADRSGNRAAPEGFPIRRGLDARMRAEAVLDVTPSDKPHAYAVQVYALSPSGRRVNLSQASVTAAARAPEIKIPLAAAVGPDWEDGIWLLRYSVDGSDAGGGQFWLAKDPGTFDFVSALKKRIVN
jgi:TonB family protein